MLINSVSQIKRYCLFTPASKTIISAKINEDYRKKQKTCQQVRRNPKRFLDEHVGIKTTRITSLGGEHLVFSNTDLTDSRIRNYKKMAKRRVVFKLGVTYQTSHEKLKKIPEIITNIINGISDTAFDRAHLNLPTQHRHYI